LLSTVVPHDATGEVARVLGCQNYYAVLEVPVTADEHEVKKHFRKKMLLVHPDKNGGAPHSNDAFDRVGTGGRTMLIEYGILGTLAVFRVLWRYFRYVRSV
jgi:hypothetical protein